MIRLLFVISMLFGGAGGGLFDGPLQDGLPPGWKPQTFRKVPKHTSYEFVEEAGGRVLKARSKGGASGLVRAVEGDDAKLKTLRWSWRAETLPKGEDARTREGDDYAARVYLVFGPVWNRKGINYVWSSSMARGASVPNAFTGRVKMLAVRGEEDAPGEWKTESRDWAEDYRSLFGEDPPKLVAVAVMSDSDNTATEATASFKDLQLLP